MSDKPPKAKSELTGKNISLAHLTPEQALLAAMSVKPPARKKAAPKPKK